MRANVVMGPSAQAERAKLEVESLMRIGTPEIDLTLAFSTQLHHQHSQISKVLLRVESFSIVLAMTFFFTNVIKTNLSWHIRVFKFSIFHDFLLQKFYQIPFYLLISPTK